MLAETLQPELMQVNPEALTELEKRLLNEYQQGLPLSPTPFADMAQHLGTTENEVLRILDDMQQQGIISRIGPVFKPKRAGASTLAAVSVPAEELESVAAYISAFAEVNHNYERLHRLNLWFVVTAPNQQRVEEVLAEIEAHCGQPVLYLPLMKPFHIDLGFPLW